MLLLACSVGLAADRESWQQEMATAAEAGRQSRIEDAEAALLRAIEAAAAGDPAPMLRVRSVEALADLYRSTARPEQAEPLYLEAIEAWDTLLGPGQPRVGITLHNLALLRLRQCRTDESLPLIERQLELWQGALGDHPDRRTAIRSQAELLRRCGEHERSADVLSRLR
jgi:tetratricopeptide (TPR) repeat protein